MSVPVSQSNVPLVVDALPALKVRYYPSVPSGSSFLPYYTYARQYVLNGSLVLSLYCFCQHPRPGDEILFALGKAPHSVLLASLLPANGGVTLQLCNTTGQGKTFPLPALPQPPRYYAGNDEQGWYWGATFTIPATTLKEAECCLTLGTQYRAAVLLKSGTKYAASYPLSSGNPLVFSRFESFIVVDY